MKQTDAWKLRSSRFETVQFSREINKQLSNLKPDNVKGAVYIAKDYAVIAACVLATLYVSWWLYPLAVLFIAAHQRGLTTISHDAAHRTLARNTTWNYVLGILFAAYPLFQRHWAYRISHVYLHHPYLGDPEKDPDLKFFLASGVYDVHPPGRYAFNIIWKPILGGATVAYLKYLWQNRFSITDIEDQKTSRSGILVDKYGFYLFWIAILIGSYSFGLIHIVILFWIVPYLTTFQVLGWFIEIAEHSPMCETETKNVYLTRNRKGNFLERSIFGLNLDEYHLEHHLSPGIPFWLLHNAQTIRMQDPQYARVASSWGGLFVKGPQGQPSVMAQLKERNRRLYEQSVASASTKEQLA
ncbi:dhydrorhizobitoxine desaturase [Bradyrhizobium cenepequi]|uniref:dhydrorhizobitoxine desaturase n=1 Tax=Bradyrhizobium cenepequi TaxID=2821403 RepID=UPI001CE397A3|nr:dhydrorhizobitoxine desaturase [Bradyrhizobium cenepequi]MCA6112493.1 fatty acid desaturase family protein [Bradyrhizobium cenepequi]